MCIQTNRQKSCYNATKVRLFVRHTIWDEIRLRAENGKMGCVSEMRLTWELVGARGVREREGERGDENDDFSVGRSDSD